MASGAPGQVYSKRAQFPSLKMSYDDLDGLFREIKTYVGHANADRSNGDVVPPYSVSITANADTVKVEGPDPLIRQLDLPESASNVTFDFYDSAGRITQVNLVLSEYTREMEVRGSDRTQVNGLHALVTKELESHASYGGRGWAFMLAIVVSVLGTLGLFRGLRRLADSERPGATEGAAILLTAVWMVPALCATWNYQLLFPSFAVYAGDVAFYKRYSAEIGLWSLGLSVVAAIVTFLRWARKTPVPTSM